MLASRQSITRLAVSSSERWWHRPQKLIHKMPARVILSFVILAVIVVGAAFPMWFTSFDPNSPTFSARLTAPGDPTFVLGTDDLGRDLFSRVLYGGQASLIIGVFAASLGLVVGTAAGMVAGYFGGWLDHVIMYLVDVQLSLPFLLLAIAVALVFGNGLLVMVVIAGLATWPGYARLCRGLILSLREYEFVSAARSLGASSGRIIFQHLLPALVAPLLIFLTINMGRVILIESALSFLGIGIKPPTPSWGGMIDQGRSLLGVAWWVSTVPGVVLTLLTLAIGSIGDWLRDVLDPMLKTE
jgi:peptide/nickel transport system permease protein